MKKNLTLYFFITILFLVSLIVTSCADTSTKFEELIGDVRVEYSGCTGCLECIDNFNCPAGAIKEDPRTHRAYIDLDDCISCMKCINSFNCPEETIVIHKDVIPPAEILNFTAISDSIGKLEIEFTSPGDDAGNGRTHRYEFGFKDMQGDSISVNFSPELPKIGGELEKYTIYELPEYDNVVVSIQAFDEMNLSSTKLIESAYIEGAHIDSIPPAPTTDLSPNLVSSSSIEINWIATGNDSLEGTADSYIIKISSTNISETNWDSIPEVPNSITPSISGSIETFNIIELEPLTEYFIAIKTLDNSGNLSDLSNIISATTTEIPDTISPSPITNLNVSSGYVASSTSITLNWTATGDDNSVGTATSYEIKHSTSAITEASWARSTLVSNLLTPKSAGSSESFIVTGLIKGQLYYFGIKAEDDNGNISEISNASSGKIVYIVNSACYGCGRCVSACTQGAIRMMGDAVIDPSKCNACGSCVSRCPVNAIKLYVISY
ncbi:MAG: 4Fe-4S dicluster domain-containing protein [Candidatus Delongbacteria bacterium]|nr:4Fe-4S dicluster domain-containing protein [Candidatus Delongbacteria bacterium]